MIFGKNYPNTLTTCKTRPALPPDTNTTDLPKEVPVSICSPLPSVSDLLASNRSARFAPGSGSVPSPLDFEPFAASSRPIFAPPVASTWTPSPELAQYTDLLTQANLEMIEHRADGLRRLQEFTVDGQDTTIDQLRTCGTIKMLPFLRMSKKVRENLLNREFIAAGRAFNRELLAAKITAAKRLGEISRDPQIPSTIQRLASAVNVRSSSGMKVEWGEINDREIPQHLMPPGIDEAMWMANLFPAAELVANATTTAAAATPATPTREPNGEPKSAPAAPSKPVEANVHATAAEAGRPNLPITTAAAKLPQSPATQTLPTTNAIKVTGPAIAASHSNNKKNRFKKRRK